MQVSNLLQGSFLKNSRRELAVSDDYSDLAVSAISTPDRPETNWCMVCIPGEEDKEFTDGSTLRVVLSNIRFDHDLYNIPTWRSLKLLYLVRLRNLPNLNLQGLRSLRVLRVLECPDLEQILCACESSHSDGLSCFQKERGCLSELQVVQLEYLPQLKITSFPMHSWKLETLWFYECASLVRLPNLSLCRKLTRLRLPGGDFSTFPGLSCNLELTELAFHWPDTGAVRNCTEEVRKKLVQDIMTLTNLRVLDMADEREISDWIPAGVSVNVGQLERLVFLDLSCASKIVAIEGLEQLVQLRALGLYGCCELRRLPDLAGFKKLKRLCVAHCHKLEVSGQSAVWAGEAFHALGESCSMGEHEVRTSRVLHRPLFFPLYP